MLILQATTKGGGGGGGVSKEKNASLGQSIGKSRGLRGTEWVGV